MLTIFVLNVFLCIVDRLLLMFSIFKKGAWKLEEKLPVLAYTLVYSVHNKHVIMLRWAEPRGIR